MHLSLISFDRDPDYSLDRIVIGDLRLSSYTAYHRSIPPAEVILHPGYGTFGYDADIALIRLSERVEFSDFVRPACLAESVNETKEYHRCMVSGWGDTREGTDYIIDSEGRAVQPKPVQIIPKKINRACSSNKGL